MGTRIAMQSSGLLYQVYLIVLNIYNSNLKSCNDRVLRNWRFVIYISCCDAEPVCDSPKNDILCVARLATEGHGIRDTGELGGYLAGSHLISSLQDPSKTLRPKCA